MIICKKCARRLLDGSSLCTRCGSPVESVDNTSTKTWKNKIPSGVWVLIILGIVALIVFFFIGFFWLDIYMEGFMSIIFIVLGVFVFGVFKKKRMRLGGIGKAMAIIFFALMGAALDQTGNRIYNKPLHICYCPKETILKRSVALINPTPGRTYWAQNFSCYNQFGKVVKKINTGLVFLVRFLEYVLVCYMLIGLRWVIWRLFRRKERSV